MTIQIYKQGAENFLSVNYKRQYLTKPEQLFLYHFTNAIKLISFEHTYPRRRRKRTCICMEDQQKQTAY